MSVAAVLAVAGLPLLTPAHAAADSFTGMAWGTLYVQMQVPDSVIGRDNICNGDESLRGWDYRPVDGPSWAQNKKPADIAKTAYAKLKPAGATGTAVQNITTLDTDTRRVSTPGGTDYLRCVYGLAFPNSELVLKGTRSTTVIPDSGEAPGQACRNHKPKADADEWIDLAYAGRPDRRTGEVGCSWTYKTVLLDFIHTHDIEFHPFFYLG